MNHHPTPEDHLDEPTSRRRFLRNAGLLGLATSTAPAWLAACGSDSTAKSNTTTADGSATSAASAGSTAATASSGETATTTSGTAAPGDVGSQLAALLKIPTDPAKSGKGTEWTFGAVLALTGTGSFYGKTMSRGIDLAVKHIAAAGGPTMKVIYKDHKSGDAPAGKQAMTELIAANVPAKQASYVDDLGAMLADTATAKMFTLDGGGGTSIFGQGQAYFWGTRAITPNDPLPGLFKWWLDGNAGKTKVGFVGWDIGEPSNGIIKADILAKVQAAGMTFNELYELVPVGNQDFSAVFPKIKANEPDVLLLGSYGQDPGSFANQAGTAGLQAKVIGFELTPDGVSASKGAYDKDGWTFAYDYFDADNPISPLAKLFVAEFKNEYGTNPDFYAANYYENTLVMWEVIRRVLDKGGDINDGDALDKALQDNLTVVSVYGGDANTVGSYTLDPKSHSVKQRGMGVFEYKAGKVTPLALFDIDGANFQKA